MKRLGFAGLVLIVLLFAAQAVSAQEGWPGCPWGYGFNPMIHGDVLECLNRPPATTVAASKRAGLAALAPAQERFVPCSFGEGVDPLLDPLALACLTQPDTGAKAASKPAGLAAPAAVAIPEQNLSCEGWGDAAYSVWADAAYNPMLYGYVPECVSRPAASESIVLKAAGSPRPRPQPSSSLSRMGRAVRRDITITS